MGKLEKQWWFKCTWAKWEQQGWWNCSFLPLPSPCFHPIFLGISAANIETFAEAPGLPRCTGGVYSADPLVLDGAAVAVRVQLGRLRQLPSARSDMASSWWCLPGINPKTMEIFFGRGPIIKMLIKMLMTVNQDVRLESRYFYYEQHLADMNLMQATIILICCKDCKPTWPSRTAGIQLVYFTWGWWGDMTSYDQDFRRNLVSG